MLSLPHAWRSVGGPRLNLGRTAVGSLETELRRLTAVISGWCADSTGPRPGPQRRQQRASMVPAAADSPT
jgi:hypothetical protein